jgi:glucan phosphoethanolaminetransferase (alkaline phosphatase superfamily)
MTTIQNHMSYTPDKYGEGYFYPDVPLNVPVSRHAETLLKVYIEGARDADTMLGQLKEYFSAQEEPVVLVFFGDHLPYLGDNQVGYQELGMAEEAYWNELGSYQTPFVIWANDTAFEILDWSAAAELPETISASFLGAAVLELTGHSSDSSWFTFLNDLRRQAPVIHKQASVLYDGSIVVESGVEAGESSHGNIPQTVAKWRQWSYYKLKYQEFDS